MAWRIDFPGAAQLFWVDVAIRIVLITTFIITEDLIPFDRIIQPEERWLYKYPQTTPYVSTTALYLITIFAAILTVLAFVPKNRSVRTAWEGLLVPSLAMPLTGLITNGIKNSVGRPRPDFFDRCYPNVKDFDASLPCTGDADDIIEGKKSFPSGHSSMTFCSFGFISLYIAAQLGVFSHKGRGTTWRFLLVVLPIVLAILMAVSRTCDYHHHWQDVTVGGIIGSLVAYLSYRQYFPSLYSSSCEVPYAILETNYHQLPTTNNVATSSTPLRRSFPQNQMQAMEDPIKLF